MFAEVCAGDEALRARNPQVRIALSDPEGSALYAHYTTGTLKAEGSSITEGIAWIRQIPKPTYPGAPGSPAIVSRFEKVGSTLRTVRVEGRPSTVKIHWQSAVTPSGRSRMTQRSVT